MGRVQRLRQLRHTFELDARDIGVRRVRCDAGERIDHAIVVRIEADRTGYLHVFVVGTEYGRLDVIRLSSHDDFRPTSQEETVLG